MQIIKRKIIYFFFTTPWVEKSALIRNNKRDYLKLYKRFDISLYIIKTNDVSNKMSYRDVNLDDTNILNNRGKVTKKWRFVEMIIKRYCLARLVAHERRHRLVDIHARSQIHVLMIVHRITCR